MPSLERHTLALCLVILIVVTLVNLRGVSETGGIFLVPTYLFIFCLLAMIALASSKRWRLAAIPSPWSHRPA
jgi:amino acid transporter